MVPERSLCLAPTGDDALMLPLIGISGEIVARQTAASEARPPREVTAMSMTILKRVSLGSLQRPVVPRRDGRLLPPSRRAPRTEVASQMPHSAGGTASRFSPPSE